MDLYRFFHPHHNPRLKKKPVRLQEICELELAAKELLRAMESASLRIRRNLAGDGSLSSETLKVNTINAFEELNTHTASEISPLGENYPKHQPLPESFNSSLNRRENASSILIDSSLNAVELAVDLLQQLIEILPEDSDGEMLELLKERENAAGWEAWSCLLKERLTMISRSTYPPCNSAPNGKEDAISSHPHQEKSTLCSLPLDDCSTSVSTPKEKRSITA